MRMHLESDVMSGVNQGGDEILDWLEEQTRRLPEHLRKPINVQDEGFWRPRLNVRGVPLECGPHSSTPSATRSSTDQQGHEGGVKTEVKEEIVPKRTLKREPSKADSTYTKIVSAMSLPSSKASAPASSGLAPGMSSDIAALAERVRQHNAGRDSKRAQAPVRKRPASAEAKTITPKKEEVESGDGE